MLYSDDPGATGTNVRGLEFQSTDFISNRASKGPGGVAVLYGDAHSKVTFDRCNLVRNHAGQSGGALAMWRMRGSLVDCTFTTNSVESDEQGSAVYLSLDSKLNISG